MKKVFSLCVGLFAGAAALSGCSRTGPAKEGQVLDWQGRPVAGAFVLYVYVKQLFSLAHSNSITYPGSIAVTDQDGRFRTEPPTHGNVWYLLVYAPSLHNAQQVPNGEGDFGAHKIEGDKIFLKNLADDSNLWISSLDSADGQIRTHIKDPTAPLPPGLPLGLATRAPKSVQDALVAALVEDARQWRTKFAAQRDSSPTWQIWVQSAEMIIKKYSRKSPADGPTTVELQDFIPAPPVSLPAVSKGIRILTPGAADVWRRDGTEPISIAYEIPCDKNDYVQYTLYKGGVQMGFSGKILDREWTRKCGGPDDRGIYRTTGFVPSQMLEPGTDYQLKMISHDGEVSGESASFRID